MKTLAGVLVFLGVVVITNLTAPSRVSASTIDWQAGNIISDAVFTNKSSMTAAAIQSFLESKVPSCDTNGTQNSELGGPDLNGDGKVQRWEYGQSRYNQTTFPCLRDYRISDGRLASQVIYDVAQKYTINPQVFLVLLQKEQGLITDTWPLAVQYRSAAGYGCPDTAPCDSQYYGLLNQLDWAGKMYRSILNNSPTWYTPYILGTNFIGYNPNRDACGGSPVNISNRSTQALYNYTPYQPNQAALDAGWGTAYCGAYGNLRFYQYFTSWFGSTRGGDLFSYDLVMEGPITTTPSDPRAGDVVTVSFSVKNVSSSTITYGSNLLQCRIGLNVNCDSSTKSGGTIPAGGVQAFSYTITPTQSGTVTIKPFFLSTSGVWYRFGPSSSSSSDKTISLPQLRATGPLSYSPKHPNVGETVKFSVPIVNNGTEPLTISTSLIQCRINGVTNCDTPPGGVDTIPAGASRTYDYAIPITTAGEYTFVAYYYFNGKWYKYIYLDSPLIVQSTDITTNGTFAISNSSPIPNQPFSINYSLTNNTASQVTIDSSVTQCRFNTSVNCDSSFKSSVNLSPGSSTAISDNFRAESTGLYRFTPYYRIGGEYHIPRTVNPIETTVSAYIADMRITDFTANAPTIGDALNVTYTVRNYGSKPAYYQNGVLQCRLNGAVNCDSSYYGQIEIAPGTSRTFSNELTPYANSGTYNLTPYYAQDGKWNTYKNSDGSPFIQRSISVQRIEPNLTIDTISLSNNTPSVGGSTTAQYRIRNNNSIPIKITRWVTQCRINGTFNCDSPGGTMGSAFTINSGQSIILETTHEVSRLGSYTLVPYFTYDSTWYTYGGNSAAAFNAH